MTAADAAAADDDADVVVVHDNYVLVIASWVKLVTVVDAAAAVYASAFYLIKAKNNYNPC